MATSWQVSQVNTLAPDWGFSRSQGTQGSGMGGKVAPAAMHFQNPSPCRNVAAGTSLAPFSPIALLSAAPWVAMSSLRLSGGGEPLSAETPPRVSGPSPILSSDPRPQTNP